MGNALLNSLEESVAAFDPTLGKEHVSSDDENTSPAAAKKY